MGNENQKQYQTQALETVTKKGFVLSATDNYFVRGLEIPLISPTINKIDALWCDKDVSQTAAVYTMQGFCTLLF
ncbi:hypothetical protein EKN56_00460 [Limnobaculum zhutongyuii]|uniref:Uncharacterized protein n=1 Tax=Limnobaculum zhutongyuii TaxID=2498113 RepID=A0A411WFF6_9GAMM|nr:hypothetical protein [Limnobaculum zhutongyuii]QBH95020.1 hypothetical protein EKN56_00460 [Limnobaculum zhutongyuii]TQS87640.1 hypothetical protein ELQ32_13460 [Limnobaculum zhutongyuii]